MRSRFTKLAAFLLCLSLACAVPRLIAGKKEKNTVGPNDQKRAVHALNRLTFGPRPEDVQQVMAVGVDRWIDQQLHPDKIPDNALESRLAPLRTLRMSSKEIFEDFPDPQVIRAVKEGKRPMPSDPARRAVYQVQIARFEQRQARKDQAKETPTPVPANSEPVEAEGAKTAEELAAAAASTADAQPATDSAGMNAMSSPDNESSANEMTTSSAESKTTPADDAEARRREDRLYADLKIQGLIDLPPDQRYKKILSLSVDEQLALADSLRGAQGQEFVVGMDPRQKETVLAMNNPQRVVVEELAQAKLLRAIYSQRQLEEVMTDFWFNHFNVFVGKGPERLLVTNYEQQVIRPRALGKFEDLLVATAKSPAMLFYLDKDERGARLHAGAGCSGEAGPLWPLRTSALSAPQSECEGAPKEYRLERKLWPRVAGVAHSERERRVLAAGCYRSGEGLYRLDD